MIPLMLAVSLAIFALAGVVIVAMGGATSRQVRQRLEDLNPAPAPAGQAHTADIRRAEPGGRIAWLNRWMVRMDLAPRARLLLYQAGIQAPVERLLLVSAAALTAAAALIYLRTRAVVPAILLGTGFFPLPFVYVLRKRAKRFAKFEQQLPEALDMLVGALQVGHSLIAGIGALGQDLAEPLAGEFRKLFDEENFGLDTHTAMTNLAVRVPLPDVRIFVAAALIQKESGGNLAEVLAQVAKTTRARFQLRKQISVHTAQGRLTGWILSLLPVGLGVGMYLVNPAGMSVLWTRPSGVKLLWTAGSMIAVGWVLIQRIVRVRV